MADERDETPPRGRGAGLSAGDLALVRAACEAGGFSRAALRLGVSQPSLSRSIARLEQRLGAALFDRSAGGATPTAFGRFVAERADAVLDALTAVDREVAQWRTGELGILRVGVGAVTRVHPLPRLIDHLARHHPALRIEVRHDVGAAIAEGVAKGRYDLALSYSGNAEGFGDLLRIRLFARQRVCAVRNGHPLTRSASITPRQLLAFPLATPGITPRLRDWLNPISRVEKRHLRHFICDDTAMICQHAALTDSVAIGPEMIFADHVARDALVCRPLEDAPAYECWMLTTPRRWATPLVRGIGDALRLSGID